MRFLQRKVGVGKWVLLVFGACAIAACSGPSDGERDDDEDDDGGTSGTAGTFGTGGASGTGGTASGGTSSVSSGCTQYCQRLAACPEGPDPACPNECAATEDLADASGCAAEFDRILGCFAGIDLCNPPAGACSAELIAADTCVSGSAADCAPTGTGPATGDCVALCQRIQACPDAEPTDCATGCSQAISNATSVGCNVEYQAYLGCMSTCTNLCAYETSDCSLELVAYSDCILCGTDPSAPECGT